MPIVLLIPLWRNSYKSLFSSIHFTSSSFLIIKIRSLPFFTAFWTESRCALKCRCCDFSNLSIEPSLNEAGTCAGE